MLRADTVGYYSLATYAPQLALDDRSTRVLANATKTTAQLATITPRWFSKLLPWVPVEAGIYRVNKVKDASRVSVACSRRDEQDFPEKSVDYEEHPREYLLSSITTTVGMSSRVAALYSGSHDQLGEQIRLAIEIIKDAASTKWLITASSAYSPKQRRRSDCRRALLLPTTSTGRLARCGRNQASSSCTLVPSLRSGESARVAELRCKWRLYPTANSSLGKGCRSFRPTNWEQTAIVEVFCSYERANIAKGQLKSLSWPIDLSVGEPRTAPDQRTTITLVYFRSLA